MKRAILISAVACLLGAAPALADITPVGILEGNSWSSGWIEDVGQYDTIAIKMKSVGDTFEAPALGSFTGVAGWSLRYQNAPDYPTLASAQGPMATGNLTFWVKHTDPQTNPFVFDIASYRDGALNNACRLWWSGSGWSWQNYGTSNLPIDWDLTYAEAVPVPGAIVLGMLGLGLAGWLKKRIG